MFGTLWLQSPEDILLAVQSSMGAGGFGLRALEKKHLPHQSGGGLLREEEIAVSFTKRERRFMSVFGGVGR